LSSLFIFHLFQVWLLVIRENRRKCSMNRL
jgi:hypothetical protein